MAGLILPFALPFSRLVRNPYDGVYLAPPQMVVDAVVRGLELREEVTGGTLASLAIARGLQKGDEVDPKTIQRMLAFFDRHTSSENPVTWLLWGGDPGRAWAKRIERRMCTADASTKGLLFLKQNPRPTTEDERAAVWRGFVEDLHGPTERDLGRRLRRFFEAYAKRIAARLLQVLGQTAERGLVLRVLTSTQLNEILAQGIEDEALRGAIGPALEKAVRRAFAFGANRIGQDALTFDPSLSPHDQIIGSLISNVGEFTKTTVAEIIRGGLSEGLTIGQMQEVLIGSPAFSPSRALRIARTETTKAVNAGSVFAYAEASKAGVDVKKEWLSSRDSNVRDAHRKKHGLDGQVVLVEAVFVIESGEFAGATARYPGDFASPALSVNCRCTVLPVVE